MSSHLTAQNTRAKFSIAPKTYVWCTMMAAGMNNDVFEVVLQVREPNDIKLTPGTEVFIDRPTISDEGYEQLSFKVIKTRNDTGSVIHECTPVQKSTHPDLRKYPRIRTNFPLQVLDNTTMVDFLVIDGSQSGLTLVTQTKNTFSGLHVGQEIPLVIDCANNEVLGITANIAHIHYNLAKRHHVVGIKLCELKRKEINLLMQKIDPKFVPEPEKIISTAVSETKISAK